ncbi:ent-kaurene oxidase [Annulohypoxylon truncatum]|uniref:ent-kaurene oxidase n=1 Tax=Annulohypoxylon truncatum TaxID=327061 RepID=UPI0020088CCD|nr:ent-kaurene oxidase [Annulohypoxylon truncatum]KAI1205902.1 ent-kaurene oxidase [Annulohypoxylon truncatum]
MPSIIENASPLTNFTTVADVLPSNVLSGSRLSYYVAISAVLLCVWLFQPAKQKCGVSAPFYKASRLKWMFSADTLIKDSYSKFRDAVYQIKTTEGVRTIIPASLVGELKGLPEDTLSARTAVREAMLSEYTKLCAGQHSDTLSLLLKCKMTGQLARMTPQLKEELEYIIGTEFPECEEWTPFKIQPFMIRTISRLSGRVFVGPALNRVEEWMDVSINFAVTAFIAVIKLQFFPPWMRPVAQYLVSELRTIDRDLEKAQAMLTPIIEERIRDSETPGYEEPDDFVQWLLDALPDDQKRDFYIQGKVQLLLSAASIHTTSNLTTDCIYDLAVHQDMQEILREEAREVLEDEEAWGKKDSMSRLKKLDSFIKESQRLSGNVTSFIRKVMKPIDLSDGTHLPAGTSLLAPMAGVAVDPRYYPDPDVFDGLRFWKLRQQQQQQQSSNTSGSSSPTTATTPCSSTTSLVTSDLLANAPCSNNPNNSNNPPGSGRWQFTSISDAAMNFGLGKHACPGRFFAASEIKMVLAYLLLNYDVRLRDGEGRPPPNMFMMTRSPSTTAEVLFRRRSAAASS